MVFRSDQTGHSLHSLSQFSKGIDMAVHAVEQVQEAFEIFSGIPCWTRAMGFEEPFSFRRRDALVLGHRLYLLLGSGVSRVASRAKGALLTRSDSKLTHFY